MVYQKTRTPKEVRIGSEGGLRSALDALKEEAEKFAPDGSVYTFIYEKKESFSPAAKTVRGLLDLDWMYSLERIQRRPELIEEFAEVMEHVKALSKILEKRRRKIQEVRREGAQKRERNRTREEGEE